MQGMPLESLDFGAAQLRPSARCTNDCAYIEPHPVEGVWITLCAGAGHSTDRNRFGTGPPGSFAFARSCPAARSGSKKIVLRPAGVSQNRPVLRQLAYGARPTQSSLSHAISTAAHDGPTEHAIAPSAQNVAARASMPARTPLA